MKHNKFSPNQNQNSPSVPPQHQPNPACRILVVENDADTRRLNSEVLIHSGYHVDAAENGAAAWDTLQLNRYDLLITAQHLPQVSGVELLKKIHATRMALPVIMATKILPTWEFALHPWLQSTTMLLQPYTHENLLGKVRDVLRATAVTREEAAPLPHWQIQPLADRFQL